MSKKKPKSISHKKQYIIAAIVAVSVILLLAASAVISWYQFNRMSMDLIGANQIRQTLVRVINEFSEPAPRDAKTGDYYFPEMKLVLSNNDNVSRVLYSYEQTDNTLRVTTQQMLNAASSKFYNTNDFHTLFERLPEYQACHRGVLLSKVPISDDDYQDLLNAGEKQLPDSSTLYAYTESGCPAQKQEIGTMLSNITSY